MKKINIVIPAYNESERLPETLAKLAEYWPTLAASYDVQVVIIDDGSSDNTAELAKTNLEKLELPHNIISYETNQGKGYAVKVGMLDSRKADYYYLADSDLSSDWDTLLKFMEFAELNTEYDCIIGSRNMPESEIDTAAGRLVSGRLSNVLINGFLNLDIKDTQCGYKLFSHKCLPAFESQKLDRFGFDFEILYIIKKLGLKTKEIGIKWENKAGSKVKPKDYINTLSELIKVKFLNRYDV